MSSTPNLTPNLKAGGDSEQRNWKFYLGEGLLLTGMVIAFAILWLSTHAK